MSGQTIDLDQLLTWVRIGTTEQCEEAEREIGARFKKVEQSRTKIFMDNVDMGVLLEDLYDFLDDLNFDASNSDDPDGWRQNWIDWKKEFRAYMFKKRQARRTEAKAQNYVAAPQPDAGDER